MRDNALNPIDEAPNLPFQGELGALLGFVFIDSAMFCRIMLLIGSSPSWVIETKRTPFLASLRTQNSEVEVVTEERLNLYSRMTSNAGGLATTGASMWRIIALTSGTFGIGRKLAAPAGSRYLPTRQSACF